MKVAVVDWRVKCASRLAVSEKESECSMFLDFVLV